MKRIASPSDRACALTVCHGQRRPEPLPTDCTHAGTLPLTISAKPSIVSPKKPTRPPEDTANFTNLIFSSRTSAGLVTIDTVPSKGSSSLARSWDALWNTGRN